MDYVKKTIPFFDPYKIAKSGQVFRFHPIDDHHSEVVAMGRYLQIACLGNDEYAFSCGSSDFEKVWREYFDLDRDYIEIYNSVDSEDRYLTDSASFSYGIRILKQDIWETVISYIISQRRSIPSITTSVDRISERFGTKISIPELSSPFVRPLKDVYYAFPDVEQLSKASLQDITDTGVGYRAEYIMSAIDDFRSGKITPELLMSRNDEDLYNTLLSMHGIGKKVANCIMLYSLGRCGMFPIDVWMQRIVDAYYNGRFPAENYPETAGIMQQFMFYYERNRP
ncbi:MAG: DNA-3-methyladenine glycosylase 2 family protein [Saccharofermentans sp.]|nr:DNA-3-methyladenine glycosylase 2 family protein [Saccharofermentans sp.]